MRILVKLVHAALIVALLGVTFSQYGCYAEEFRGSNGRAYRHERWHDEHVYQHEDGRWYARRNGVWEPRLEVHID